MRSFRLLASITLTAALLVNATPAGAIAYRRIDAVSFSDANNGWISGGRDPRTGFVSRTTDGGATWHTSTVANRWFYGVEADGAGGGWAVSDYQNNVLRSVDGGATWVTKGPILSGDGTTLKGALKIGSRIVVFGQNKSAQNNGYPAGDPAVIASSIDDGATWSKQYQGPHYPAPDEFTNPPTTVAELISGDSMDSESTAYIAGNEWTPGSGGDTSKITYARPLIFKTTDSGATWTDQSVSSGISALNPVTSVTMGSPTVAFAGTSNRLVLRTTDGVNWAQLRLPRRLGYMSPSATAVDAWGENTLLVGGGGGFVAWSSTAKTAPSDSTVESDWTYRLIPGGPNINSVQILSPTSGIVVGDEETIAKTVDSGASWTPLPSGPPVTLLTAPAAGFPLALVPITIQGQASDPGVGVEKVEVRIRRADGQCFNGIGWTATEHWLPANTSNRWDNWNYTWTPDSALMASGQLVTVSARGTDGAGLSATSAGVSSGAPMFSSISLEGGNPYTKVSPVTASLSANGATHMRWKVDSGSFNSWQPFASTASVALPGGDGVKTVTFEFSSDGVNPASTATDSITLHTSLPTVSMTSPSNGFGVGGPVSIAGTASDAGGSVSAVQVVIRRADGQSWSGSGWTGGDNWLSATTGNGYANWQYSWTPAQVGDQIVTVQARAVDMAGLVSTSPLVSSASPVAASVSLAGGAAYTTDTSISAGISATGVTDMRWRVAGQAFNAWQPYSTTASITLVPTTDGTKTVDFEFSADGGNTIAGTASDSIVLHTSLPSVAVSAPSAGFRLTLAPVNIVGTASDIGLSVASTQVLIRRADGLSWNGIAWAAGDNWRDVTTSNGFANWSYLWMPGLAAIDPGDIVSVYARARDASGLMTTTAGLTSGSAVHASAALEGGATYVNTRTVEAAVNAETMTRLRYKVSGEASSAWAPYSTTPVVYIGGADGTKTVTFEFSTDQVNIGAVASDDIYLDTTAPALQVTQPTAQFALTVPVRTISGTSSDGGSGLSAVQIRIQRGGEYWNGASWQGLESWVDADIAGGNWSYNWQVDTGTSAGHLPVTVTARSRDVAGNVRTGSPVSSVNPLDPTAVTLTSASSTITYGGTGYIKGTATWLGEPFPNATVKLYAGTSSSTSTMKWVTNAKADSAGKFSFSVKPASKTYYQVRYVGEGGRASSSSTVIAHTPKAYVTTPVASSSARRNVAFSSYGYIKPKHTAGSYPVRIYLYRYVNGTYTYYRYVNAKAYNYSSYTKYVASVKLPYAGKWRMRAYHSDSGHATTVSSYRYVTVR